jgi:predicted metallopeptidase
MTYTNTSSTYYFEPSDVIEIISDYATLSTGDKVKVSVENGVFDSITLS